MTEAPRRARTHYYWSPRNPQTGMDGRLFWRLLLWGVSVNSYIGAFAEIVNDAFVTELTHRFWRNFFNCGGGVRSFPWEFGFRLDRFSGGKHETWPCGILIPISLSSSQRSGNRSTSGLITPPASKARGWWINRYKNAGLWDSCRLGCGVSYFACCYLARIFATSGLCSVGGRSLTVTY